MRLAWRSGLGENVLRRLRYLNTWLLMVGAVWGGVVGAAPLEEVCEGGV